MQVRIVEARHHEVALQVDQLCLVTLELLQVRQLSDRLNAVAAHCNGLRSNDRTECPFGWHARVHIPVHEYDVGLWPCRLITRCLRHAHHYASNRKYKCSAQACSSSQAHSPTPASANIVSKILFSANSRPFESNHSWRVCARRLSRHRRSPQP